MQKLDSLIDVSRLPVVVSEPSQVLLEAIVIQLFDGGAYFFVKILAPLQQKRFMRDPPCQCMLEDVSDLARGGLLVNELGQLQIV